MSCLLCGREAPYDTENGAPPDTFCPRCRPFEEAYTILAEWSDTIAHAEAVVTKVDQNIVDRVASTTEELRYLDRVIKAIQSVPKEG